MTPPLGLILTRMQRRVARSAVERDPCLDPIEDEVIALGFQSIERRSLPLSRREKESSSMASVK